MHFVTMDDCFIIDFTIFTPNIKQRAKKYKKVE
jgi:hypothetical protein